MQRVTWHSRSRWTPSTHRVAQNNEDHAPRRWPQQTTTASRERVDDVARLPAMHAHACRGYVDPAHFGTRQAAPLSCEGRRWDAALLLPDSREAT